MERSATVANYIAYHKAAPLFSGQSLIPIHVGRAIAERPLPDMIGDDTGDGISDRNPFYCELTAHYWAWKNNSAAQFIGLMHYRRLFDIAPSTTEIPERFTPYLDAATFSAGCDDFFKTMTAESFDILVPFPRELHDTTYQSYGRFHPLSDLDRLRDIVAVRRPDFLGDFDNMLAGKEVLVGNMFVMRRPLFEHYSELLFDLMQAFHDAPPPDLEARSTFQRRYIGFLAERVLTAYIPYALRHFPQMRVERRTILIADKAVVKDRSFFRLMRFVLDGRLSARDFMRLRRERRQAVAEQSSTGTRT